MYENCDCDSELQRLKDSEETLLRERQERHQARLQELKELREERMRTALSWKESLLKQAALFQKEGRYQMKESVYPEPDESGQNPFILATEACKKGFQMWEEIESEKAVEISQLKSRLLAIQDEILLLVKSRMMELCADSEMAQSFISDFGDEDAEPSDWLDW